MLGLKLIHVSKMGSQVYLYPIRWLKSLIYVYLDVLRNFLPSLLYACFDVWLYFCQTIPMYLNVCIIQLVALWEKTRLYYMWSKNGPGSFVYANCLRSPLYVVRDSCNKGNPNNVCPKMKSSKNSHNDIDFVLPSCKNFNQVWFHNVCSP